MASREYNDLARTSRDNINQTIANSNFLVPAPLADGEARPPITFRVISPNDCFWGLVFCALPLADETRFFCDMIFCLLQLLTHMR